MDLENGPKMEPHSGVIFDRFSVESSQRELSEENEELKQKIKILEEENARLRGELEVPKVDESIASTPTHQMVAPAAQTMDREKENSKSEGFAKESRRDSRLGSSGTPTKPLGGAKPRSSLDVTDRRSVKSTDDKFIMVIASNHNKNF